MSDNSKEVEAQGLVVAFMSDGEPAEARILALAKLHHLDPASAVIAIGAVALMARLAADDDAWAKATRVLKEKNEAAELRRRERDKSEKAG